MLNGFLGNKRFLIGCVICGAISFFTGMITGMTYQQPLVSLTGATVALAFILPPARYLFLRLNAD